jgi:two-component system LytT family sensor kinase
VTASPSPARYPFRWTTLFAAWSVVAVFSFTHALLLLWMLGRTVTVWREAVSGAVDAYQWALYTPLVFALAGRFPVRRRGLARSLAVHLAAGSGFAVLTVAINWGVSYLLYAPGVTPFPRYLGQMYHYNLQWYAIVVAIRYALDRYRAHRDRELHASQVEAQLARARLEALQMRIEPHFLFNVLNTVSEQMHHDLRTADEMMGQLGDLLRMAFDRTLADTVPLHEEMRFATAYLALQQARFRDTLTVETDVAAEAAEARVPSFILQPLVENAIRHGIAPRGGSGHVAVRARREGAALVVAVEDDGLGLDAPPPGEGRAGVGLRNVAERLTQRYGDACRLEVFDRADGGAATVLAIPFEAGEPVPA